MAIIILHRVIYSGLNTWLQNHYYTRCTELETENSWEENDLEKRKFWGGYEKQSELQLRWRRAADWIS